MNTPKEKDISLDKVFGVECPLCKKPMKRVSWKITAGAHDARYEVEQTVFQCDQDKNFVSIEVSTGNPSEFA